VTLAITGQKNKSTWKKYIQEGALSDYGKQNSKQKWEEPQPFIGKEL